MRVFDVRILVVLLAVSAGCGEKQPEAPSAPPPAPAAEPAAPPAPAPAEAQPATTAEPAPPATPPQATPEKPAPSAPKPPAPAATPPAAPAQRAPPPPAPKPAEPVPAPKAEPGAPATSAPAHAKVGDGKCKMCHRLQHQSWAASPHAAKGLDCEGCHGNGGDYWPAGVMRDRAKAVAAGLVLPTLASCRKCHASADAALFARVHAHKAR